MAGMVTPPPAQGGQREAALMLSQQCCTIQIATTKPKGADTMNRIEAEQLAQEHNDTIVRITDTMTYRERYAAERVAERLHFKLTQAQATEPWTVRWSEADNTLSIVDKTPPTGPSFRIVL
jgi:hypothetical protein